MPTGAMRIVRFETQAEIEGLRVAEGFGAIVRSEDVPAMFARTLSAGGTITAALRDGVVVGYAADLPFVPIVWDGGRVERRWDALPAVRELGAVEVALPFRNRGIARELMRALAAGGRLDRFIVIAEALHWHWDLAASGIDVWEYRRRLVRLLESAGFRRFDTDAPDVSEHAANFLAARIGPRSGIPAQRAFAEALFAQAA
jgi:GNAT superfamily N-acetyltransferase